MPKKRKYKISDSITFTIDSEDFGFLSNMASGFALYVNDINIESTEALFQACKFPHKPRIQKEIISQSTPMQAKDVADKNKKYIRKDWEQVRFKIMQWCLRVKYIQNKKALHDLMMTTGNKPIVEHSAIDDVWGACSYSKNYLYGANALGTLLMRLREEIINENMESVRPLDITDFVLYEKAIEEIFTAEYYLEDE